MKGVCVQRKSCSIWYQGGYMFYKFLRRNLRFCIFAFNIYAITFAIVLPSICSDWAYSKYYFSGWPRSQMEQRAAELNNHYVAKAHEYIENLSANNSLHFHKQLRSKEGVDLAIGIVTIPRFHQPYKLDYLTQTFVRLDQSLNQDLENFEKKVLFMCNTFPGPGNHTELQLLTSLVSVNSRYPKYNATAAIMDRFEKEKQDYSYCIDVALTYKPKYVLIVEDDTLARDNIFEILHYALMNLVENKFSGGDLNHNTEEWAYLKLFYPDRWKGYAFEIPRLLELIAIGSIGGPLFVLIGFKCSRKESMVCPTLIYFVVGSVYFILVALMIGRPYLIEWRRISKYTYTVVPAPDCCSPAILYAADRAKKLSAYLKTVKCESKYPIDFAMDKFAKIYNYKKYLIEPNLMQHIGMFSSIKTKSKHPQEFIYR